MPAPTSARDRPRPRVGSAGIGPVRSVSVLLGAAVSLTTVGLIARFETVFSTDDGSGASVAGLVLGVVFVALFVGMRVPRRFALWACSLAWRNIRVGENRPDPPDDWLRPLHVDRPLHWMVLAVIALTAGVVTALLPIGAFVGATAYDWMHGHFVWSAGPLVMLQILTVLLAASLPLALFGLATSGAHRMSCPTGGWEPSATGWILVGAGAGALVGAMIVRANAPPDLLLVSAALPALAMTLFAVQGGASSNDGGAASRIPNLPALPMCSDPWPRLLRGALVAVGVCGFGVAMVWLSLGASEVYPDNRLPAAALLLAGGIGTLAGCRRGRDGRRTIGGFGAACAAAGVTIALGLSLAEHASLSIVSRRLPAACASTAVVAYAAAYGRRTLLACVANRPFVGMRVVTRTLVGGALLVWVVQPMLVSRMGGSAVLLAFALVLLALGGTLIIHEPTYSPRTRRVRLCAVFASIGAMISIVLIRSN